MVKLRKYKVFRSTVTHKKVNLLKRKVTIYRYITWLDPKPEFVAEMLERFKYRKQVSYSKRHNRLYLYGKFRSWETITRLDPKEPIRGFYEFLETGD